MGADDLARQVQSIREAHGLPVQTARARMLAAKVPSGLLLRVDSDEEKATAALAAVRKFLEKKGKLLVLAGTAGCGKSFASAWACGQVIGAGYVLAYEFEKPDDDLDKRVSRSALLVIDDAGEEYISEKRYASSRIEQAIIQRDAAELPTILSTNLMPLEFRERFGERAASRLNGEAPGNGGGWVSLPGGDLRLSRKSR